MSVLKGFIEAKISIYREVSEFEKTRVCFGLTLGQQ